MARILGSSSERSERVEIYRDAYGVPHIRATSVTDLAHGQGLAVARDRSWQLEWLRRRATGTTAEVFGESGVPWDRLARRTLLTRTALRAYDALDDETRGFVDSYVDGVNAGLHADAPELAELGIEPQPWPAWMPLATFQAQHIQFGTLGDDLWRRRAEQVLGDDASLLSREDPGANGSNAWAVGGARTASGLPLVAGDPHRTIEQPGVYLQMRLCCEDTDDAFDVVGFAFAGVPGVQHFAHAGDVAWAITNAMAAYQDVAVAGEVLEEWTESIPMRDADAVEVGVRVTDRGPEFVDGLAFRQPSTELGDLGFAALLPLLRARTVDDVDRAIDAWVEPVNNAVIADVHGAVRYRLMGRIPLRDEAGEWVGWHDPNRQDVAASGQVVTANERRGPESELVGRTFAPAFRADRIAQLLDGRSDLAVDDFAAIHRDTELLSVPVLAALVPGEFDDWDGRMTADSATAARFAAWRSALVRRIVAEPVFAPLHEPHGDPVFALWMGLHARVALALPGLVAAGSPFGLDLPRLAKEALEDLGGRSVIRGATWGETHVFGPTHAFDLHGRTPPDIPRPPVDGDNDCVMCAGALAAVTGVCYRGSVARYVWDLADRSASGWVVPTGAAGHPDSPHHHDQLDAWVAGRLVPIVTDWEQLTEEPVASP